MRRSFTRWQIIFQSRAFKKVRVLLNKEGEVHTAYTRISNIEYQLTMTVDMLD
jgi:hypothetical protein